MIWFAFSMEDQVEKYGAYVGIAAFFGLAVLSLLYFSQARELKRLREWAGRAPERDIAIEVIGPRPGEKLHEELFNRYERAQPTPAQKIMRADHPRLDPAWERETFDQVSYLVLDGDAAALVAKVAELAAVRQVPPALDPSAAISLELPASRDGA